MDETRTERATGPNGAVAEIGVLVHEGREFRALGSVVDHAEGRVTAYPAEDGSAP